MKLNWFNSVTNLLIVFIVSVVLFIRFNQTTIATVEPIKKPKFVESKIFFDRIFMHEIEHYSTFSVNEDKNVAINSYHRGLYNKFTLICDVETGDKMWADVSDNGNWMERKYDVIFHIRSLKDLNGAGWNHGKFGIGNTVLIE